MFEAILEIVGDLLLSSKKVKPWVKTTFFCTVLLALVLMLCWGIYLNWIHGSSTRDTILLSAIIAAALLFGFFYAWKCHRNNWEKY